MSATWTGAPESSHQLNLVFHQLILPYSVNFYQETTDEVTVSHEQRKEISFGADQSENLSKIAGMALKDFVVSRQYLVLLFESEQNHQPGKIEAALVFIETENWQIVAVSRPPGDVAEINQAG